MREPPFFSVVIPTYQRPDLLPRAVDSVLRQTFADWEIIISDDEPTEGETWQLMHRLAATDPRIRITRNPGPAHGQTPNVNHAFAQARGRWIKPLWDDDELLPECLAYFRAAIESQPDVVYITCDGQRVKKLPPPPVAPPRPPVTAYRTESLQTLLAQYRQEATGEGPPTRMAVLRDVVANGVIFEEIPGISTAVDLLWFTRIAAAGPALWIRAVLVREYQTGQSSVTSRVTEESLDQQFAVVRRYQHDLLPPGDRRPSLAVSLQSLTVLRAAHRLRNGQPFASLQLGLGAWNPLAWWHAIRMIAQRGFPFLLSQINRTQITITRVAEPRLTLPPH
jgi:glycosyltransferase involved in cell wall biosynthesis